MSKSILISFLFISFFINGCSDMEKIQELEKKIQVLEKENKKLKKELNRYKSREKRLQKELFD